MLAGFFSEPLCAIVFLEGDGDAAARYERVRARLTVDDDTKTRLGHFFAAFGTGYLQAERERISGALSFLCRQRDAYGQEKEKNVKLVRSLLLAAAFGLIILLI